MSGKNTTNGCAWADIYDIINKNIMRFVLQLIIKRAENFILGGICSEKFFNQLTRKNKKFQSS